MTLPQLHLPNLTQIIEVVVIFIAAGSFAISFNNLHQSAILMGIPDGFNIIFPLTIDAFLIVCTLYVLYAGRKCKPTWEGWLFLVLYTIASIAFNIHMAPDDWWSRAGFAMCPIGLCVALHFLMRILEIEMGGCPVPVNEVEIEGPSIALPPMLEMCRCAVPDIEAGDYIIPHPIQSAPIDTEKEYPVQELTDNQRKVYEAYKEEPKMKKSEAVRRTGLTYKTVSKHYNTLKEMGMIKDE